jgi:hypothetical protein
MNRPFRSLSIFLTGVAFFAFFVTTNCQPTGGDTAISGEGTGGKGTGGKDENGGSGGNDENGGSGGNDDTGGSDGTGGKGTGGKATGGNAGSGGSAGSGTGGNAGGGSLKCSPTTATGTISTTGGLACPGGLCTVDTYAGYIYVYADGTSTICAGPDALCASGSTGVADTAGKIWGAGVGFNLDKTDPPADVQLSGTGMTYALSALPTQGMRAQVSVGSKDYCVALTKASGTVAWTDFSDACWGTTGTKLTGAPKTPHIGFQVTAGTATGKFDFCVKSVSFK